MKRDNFKVCKYCDSGNIIKRGTRQNKRCIVQKYQCKDCKKRFVLNCGFESMRYDDTMITGTMQMYFTGMSVRDITDHYEMLEIDMSHMAIYKWTTKYSKNISEYLERITPHLGTWFRADEVWVKVNGSQKYLFASMCDDIRFWIAEDIAHTKFQHNVDTLLELTKQTAGNKNPKHFITGGLPAYRKSSKKIFGKYTLHTRHIHLKGNRNNNKMERLNGEIRDREKTFRELKKFDTPIIEGMKVYYNFTKKQFS